MENSPTLPPSSPDSEYAILATMFCYNWNVRERMAQCNQAGITPASFTDPKYQAIYAAMLDIYEKGLEPDCVLVPQFLQACGKMELVGMECLQSLITTNVGAAGNFPFHLERIKSLQNKARILSMAKVVAERAGTDSANVDDIISSMSIGISEISLSQKDASNYLMSELYENDKEAMERFINGDKELMGLSTGYSDLDNIIGGLKPKNLIVIGAFTGVGKSAMAANLVVNVLTGSIPQNIFFVSTEMKRLEIIKRMFSCMSGVSEGHLQDKVITESQKEELRSINKRIYNFNWKIDDGEQKDVFMLKERVRKFNEKSRVGLVVVDYIQQIPPSSTKISREQQVSEVSRNLKALAMELDCPVVALSQINRESEKDNRKPKLTDLRESGAIEQDADIVILMHRKSDESGEDNGIRELIVAKNRSGKVGATKLQFSPAISRFSLLSKKSVDSQY